MPTEKGQEAFLESQLGYNLRRASALVMADLAGALGALDLRIAEASVLLVVAEAPGATQSAVGRRLGIQRANMAPLVAGLEQKKLVDRQPFDGRSVGLSVTVSGQAVVQAVRDVVLEHESRIFQVLQPDERAMLSTLLRRVWLQLEPAVEDAVAL